MFGSGAGGQQLMIEASDAPGSRPGGSADVHRQRPRRLNVRDDRDRDRRDRPQHRIVSACSTGTHNVAEGAEAIRRGDCIAVFCGSTEAPLLEVGTPASQTCAAWACPGPASRRDGVAAVRPDPRRLRARRGRRRAVARGPRDGEGARREDLRRVVGYGSPPDGGTCPADREWDRFGQSDGARPRATRVPADEVDMIILPRDGDAARRQARGRGDTL